MILKRHTFVPDGIFGVLSDGVENLAYTLEHSYGSGSDWHPKLPPGDYQCVRGIHRLTGLIQALETFEVTNVPGHTGILFHIGNYNKDSEGCILLGKARGVGSILNSYQAFQDFMEEMQGIDTFPLTVE